MTKNERKPRNVYQVVGMAIIGIILLVISGSWLIDTIGKADSRRNAEDILARIDMPGEAVHTMVDEYCTDDPTISVTISGSKASKCSARGYKVYRTAGNVADGVKVAENVLKSLGFEPSRSVTIERSGKIPYHNPNKPTLTASLEYVSSEAKDAMATIGNSSNIPLNGGYLYGIGVFSSR